MEWIIPLIWLLIAVILIIVESMTFNLVTIWFSLGAIAAMFVSIVIPYNFGIQVVVFVVVSIAIMLAIRNYALNKLRGTTIKTNVNSLIGKKAIVTQTIEPYKYGEVKIEGNFWTAKPEKDETIEVSSIVEIVEISGVKLIVKKIE